jgi:hypothetical protein
LTLKQCGVAGDHDFMSSTETTVTADTAGTDSTVGTVGSVGTVGTVGPVIDMSNDGSELLHDSDPTAATSSTWNGLEQRERSRRTTDHRRDAVWVAALLIRSVAAVLLVKFSPPATIIFTVAPLSVGLSIASKTPPSQAPRWE